MTASRPMFVTTMLAVCFLLCCNNAGRIEDMGGQEKEADTPRSKTVYFKADMKSLIRNPAMGWVLYDDAAGNVSKAEEYWNDQGVVADMFGSVFYWRSRWSELEPQEGVYAWEHDENFKAIIKGALDRGLKLAFRVYVDSQDNIRQATPDFVRQAGAQGYVNTHWTPYCDDPIFQEKFSNFIKAFAKQFDNPDIVDFIDAYNLGWWGEGHHVQYLDSKNKSSVFKWLTELYGQSFKNVLLVTNFGTEMGFDLEKKFAIDAQGYIIRRDSMGSTWFREDDIKTVLSVFPETAFIAECCYWGGCADSYQPWKDDPLYKNIYTGWPDFYAQAYSDAIAARANMLDLRQAAESRGWTRRARELVDAFMVNGGYRFTPTEISYPEEIRSGVAFTLSHKWENAGVGVCPNNNRRWNYKYHVAFALFSQNGEMVDIQVLDDAEPSLWLKEKPGKYSSSVTFGAPEGEYKLATAIVDTTQDNRPGLNLAVKKAVYIEDWLEIGTIKITR